ncbi:MAG: ROK family protein [Chloroflexi bacterium]|nr:ROK family protein [Chloroflexota bacterium]
MDARFRHQLERIKPIMTKRLIACCDLGGTKMLAGLVSSQGELLAVEKYLINGRGSPQAVLDDLDAVLRRMLASIGRKYDDLAALGFSSTGVLNIETGIVAMNHNIGWVNVPLRDMAAQRFGLPVILEMDANAAALGEYWKGAARGISAFALVIVGTGIGSGLMLDKRIWHGAHSVAGEIGHTVILPGGPLCGCGKHGCLEALASGLAISRRAEAALKLGRTSVLQVSDQAISGQQVVEAARAGDELARSILEESGFYLGVGLANLITLLDPQVIVIGGGLGVGAFDLLEAPMKRAVQQHLNYWAARSTPIIPSALGEYAGLYGAARAALDAVSQSILSEVTK